MKEIKGTREKSEVGSRKCRSLSSEAYRREQRALGMEQKEEGDRRPKTEGRSLSSAACRRELGVMKIIHLFFVVLILFSCSKDPLDTVFFDFSGNRGSK
mgnify:CR=1 FL=1